LNNFEASDSVERESKSNADAILSAIANYITGQMISIIELEKVAFGDPAFYKYKYDKSTKQQYRLINPQNKEEIEVELDILSEKDSDKIKRLGAVLSPGSEIDAWYSDSVLARHPELKSSKYTIASIQDISARSVYYEESVLRFKKQLVADYIRLNQNDPEIARITHTSIDVVSVERPILNYQTKKITRTFAKQ
jgi:hypothetical protein